MRNQSRRSPITSKLPIAAKPSSAPDVGWHRIFTSASYNGSIGAVTPDAADVGRTGNVGGRFVRWVSAMGFAVLGFFAAALSLFALAARQLKQSNASVDQLTEREFPSADSEAIPISGFFTGLIIAEGILVLAAICFFWLPPMVLLVSLGLIIGPLLGLTMRCGGCPNCGRKVQIMSAVSVSKCPSCKHRLEIRDKRIVDLT
jgi:hypothetical protein